MENRDFSRFSIHLEITRLTKRSVGDLFQYSLSGNSRKRCGLLDAAEVIGFPTVFPIQRCRDLNREFVQSFFQCPTQIISERRDDLNSETLAVHKHFHAFVGIGDLKADPLALRRLKRVAVADISAELRRFLREVVRELDLFFFGKGRFFS